MKRRLITVIIACGLGVLLPGQTTSPASQQELSPEQAKELQEAQARKKDLLKLMEKLEDKLPAELARKLIIISMKLSTGYCSPLSAQELEEEIDKLPEKDRKKFEKEWKLVHEHKEWPCTKHKAVEASPKSK